MPLTFNDPMLLPSGAWMTLPAFFRAEQVAEKSIRRGTTTTGAKAHDDCRTYAALKGRSSTMVETFTVVQTFVCFSASCEEVA
jgi:hypothetical protein